MANVLGEIEAKAIRGVSWSIVQRTGTYVVQFAVFLLLARLLEPRAFGLLSLALVYVTFVQIFVDQGVGDAIIQQPTLDRETLDTAYWSNVAAGVLFWALGLGAAPVIATVFGEPELAPLIRWLSVLFPLNALSVIPQCLLRRELRFRSLALRALVQQAGGGCVGVVLALRGFGVWSLVWQQIAAAVIGVGVLWIATEWRPRLRFSGAGWKRLLWFGANITGVNLLILVSRQADNLIIGYMLGPVMLGYYTIAYQVLLTIANLLVGTINSVTLPFFSRQQSDPARIRAALNKLTSVTSAVATPCFLGMAVLAPEAVEVIFGERWMPSVTTLQVLCLIGTLYAGFYFHGPLLTAVGKPQWNLALNAVQAVSNVVAFAIGVRWGIVGVAAAYVLRAYVTAPIHFVVLRRQVGLVTTTYLKQFVPSVLAGGAMVLVVGGVKLAVSARFSAVGTLLAGIPLGAATYFAVLSVLQPDLRHEAARVIRDLLPRRVSGALGPLSAGGPAE